MDDAIDPVAAEQKRERLKRLLEQRGAGGLRPALIGSPVPSRSRSSLAVSFAQERLFLLEQLAPGNGAYHLPHVLRIRSAIDVGILERSLATLAARHEALRTSFRLTPNGPVQSIHDPRALLPRAILERDATDETISQLLEDEIRRPFDLAEGPLLRVSLFRRAPDDNILLFVMHHIVSDRRSMQILSQELLTCYLAESQGRAAQLSEITAQPADLAALERQHLSGPRRDVLLNYWRQELTGAPALRLTGHQPTGATAGPAGKHQSVLLDLQTLAKLKEQGAEHHATLFMTLFAALAAFVANRTGQRDFVIGTPVSQRVDAAARGVVGLFVNILPMRVQLNPTDTFGQLLLQTRDRCLSAYEHQDLPFDHLVSALKLPRDAVEATLTPVMFQLDTLPTRDIRVASVEGAYVHWGAVKFDWDVCVTELPDVGLRVDVEYRSDRFDDHWMTGQLESFAGMLRTLSSQSVLRDILPADGHDIAKSTWPPELDETLHELFHAQAGRSPAAIAVEHASARMTYGTLDELSSRVCSRLRASGVADGDFVGLLATPGLDTIVAMLGILKAGGAYVPLDPAFPVDRLRFMASDASLGIVIGDASQVAGLNVPVVSVETLLADPTADAPLSVKRPVNADSPVACLMYTSGSTGKPKGVITTHQGIIRLFFGQTYARFAPDEAFLQMAPLSFDASTFELWGALLHGGRAVLETGRIPHAAELGALIQRCGITTAWLTASLFNVIVDQDPAVLRPLRQLLIGGEALSPSHVRRALAALPETAIINGYGPTETTVFACCYRLPHHLPDDVTTIPIGSAIAHTSVFVMNDSGQPVEAGEPGELWIAGPGVARGYLNQPELSAVKFVTNRALASADLVFRTGDRARQRPDGSLEFLGRFDRQVKIRGRRIELEEIESTIRQHPLISAASVMVTEQPDGTPRLVAFFSSGQAQAAAADLHTFLAERLPGYMVPAALVPLPALPLMANGKLDREALLALLPSLSGPNVSRTESATTATVPTRVGDTLEARLARIWCNILKVSDVGGDENFFDAGGDSLAALRLLGSIHAEFGTHLELSAIYNAPTIQTQAALLRRGEIAAGHIWIVRAGGDGPPVFCAGGDRLWLHVADHLARPRPMIGAAMNFEKAAASPDPIASLAADFIRAIRECQPHGPYTLAGWCLMGLVAFEAAQQLRRTGEQVELVVMADTFPPFPSQGLSKRASFVSWIRMELASAWFHWTTQMRLQRGQRLPYLWDKVQGFSHRFRLRRRSRAAAVSNRTAPDLPGADEPAAALSRIVAASYRYRASPYDGRVLFCTPMRRPPGRAWRFGPIWERVVSGPFENLQLPGDHRTMFELPSIQQLADRLSAPEPH